jgi:hypothetical protein
MEQAEQSGVLQSIQEFLQAQASQSRNDEACLRCGKPMKHLGVTFWLYESDFECSLQLPICGCESPESSPEDRIVSTDGAPLRISATWKELYMAALREADKSRLPERIFHAQMALNLRSRELFYAGEEQVEERRAVDAAMNALQGLRSTCLENKKRVRHFSSKTPRVA